MQSVLEVADLNNLEIFGSRSDQLTPQQLVTKYSMFISSLLDPRYRWFYDDLVKSNHLHLMLIDEANFDTLVGFFRTACIRLQIKKDVVVRFSEFLIAAKEYLCIGAGKQDGGQHEPEVTRNLSLNESLEQDQRFEVFIEKFFDMLAQNNLLQSTRAFESQEAQQALIVRVANILQC